jgi:predicted MPP superfamily phosphohydrolase
LEDPQEILPRLEKRLGRLHARQRLAIEREHEGQIFGGGINFFHIENWYSIHSLIKNALKVSGLFWRGVRNSAQIQVRHHHIRHTLIPETFRAFTILQLSDLHVDMCPLAMQRLTEILRELNYDLCVLTGDYRGQTYGPYDAALAGMARIRAELSRPTYGVLGNHDTVCMVPAMEEMGIRMLLNESVAIERGGQHIYLAGIDDAHFYRVDNIEKAASEIPHGKFSILLSHTPEIYRQAAHAGLNVMAALPRHMGSGAWRHHSMVGYTSVGAGAAIVAVRFNCRPEVTLHHLELA